MKIVSLNTWHGKCQDELAVFLKKEAPATDVFCFQEAGQETRKYLQQLLPDFMEYAHDKIEGDRTRFGLATYVKRHYSVVDTFALLDDAPDSGSAFVATIQTGDAAITVANVHGIPFAPDDKRDTKGRLVQSKTIIEALSGIRRPILIGGDFNLLPETSSVRMFAQAGYQDLIAKYGILTTRNRLAWERYPDNIQRYADYFFASSAVRVRRFEVPQCEISDHLPLIVEFDVVRAGSHPQREISAASESQASLS